MDWAAALIDSSSLLIASPFNQATKQRDPKTGEVKTKNKKTVAEDKTRLSVSTQRSLFYRYKHGACSQSICVEISRN